MQNSRPKLTSPLSVALIVADRAALRDDERRLIAHLVEDDRFEIAAIASIAVKRRQGPLETLEAAAIPVPCRNPAPEVEIAAIPATIAETGTDVIVDLSGQEMSQELASQSNFGLWSIWEREKRAKSASFVGRHVTDVELVCHSGVGDPQVISRAYFDTKILASHNIAYVREKSGQLIRRELARLDRDRELPSLGSPKSAKPMSTIASIPGYAARVLSDGIGRVAIRIAEKRGKTPQPFALRFGNGNVVNFDPAAAQQADMPDPGLWADPFLFAHQGATYCSFEDLDPITQRGHISVGVLEDGKLKDVRPALKLPVHMSYPFVFAHNDDVFMIPETHEAGRLEIGRATQFPDAWELHSTAFQGSPVADTALLHQGQDWWLFTHISNDRFGDYCNELRLFKVDGPDLNAITPHRLNPVVVGADTARGGGRPQALDGRLFRPSQDNSGGTYGYGLNIMEITQLDLDHYEEHRARHVTPDFAPGLIGCHHFDAHGAYFVIDVRHA